MTPDRALRRGLVLLRVGLLLSLPTVALGGQVDEYDVKAAFLLNFAKFVQWPPGTSSHNLVICIVGDDPFGNTIDRLVRGKSAAQRPLEVRRLKEPRDAQSCHIAFVRAAEHEKASKLLAGVSELPVLTVGDAEDFADRGGVVSLPVEDGRVGLVINVGAAERAQLKISATLLSIAQIHPDPRARD
jgi:YfiR/HmsC-like